MANRRSRKQIHEFTHPKVVGEIPVFLVKDPDIDGVTFEIDLTVPKLAQRMPFCKTGDAVQALVAEAQSFIDTYLGLAWEKEIVMRAKQTITNSGAVGVEFAYAVVEKTAWPKDGTTLWRNADVPWETRGEAMPSGWDAAECVKVSWSPAAEETVAKLRAKVVSFAGEILKSLQPQNQAKA